MSIKLNYDGLSPEQIRYFVDNVEVSVEVDAVVQLQATTDGNLEYTEPESNGATGWLSGTLFGVDFNDNLGVNHEDLYHIALEEYKKCTDNDEQLFENIVIRIPSLQYFS